MVEGKGPVATLLRRGVLVCVTGQDDKRDKAHSAPFFKSTGTLTTLSASGTVIPRNMLGDGPFRSFENTTSGQQQTQHTQSDTSLSVMTSAALVWPFMKRHPDVTRSTLAAMTSEDFIPYTTLSALCPTPDGPKWAEAKLCGIIEVQGAIDTAARMAAGEIPLEGCGRSWEFGWRPYSGSGFSTSSAAAGSSGRPAPLPFGGVGHLAILSVEIPSHAGQPAGLKSGQVQPHPCYGSTMVDMLRESALQRGDWLALSGSPFGALSPGTFFNTVSVGILSNLLQPLQAETAAGPSLMSVDARLLPGQEGGPVVDRDGHLIGIMTLPIRLARAGTELPLCLSFGAVLATLRSSRNGDAACRAPPGPVIAPAGISTKPLASPSPQARGSSQETSLAEALRGIVLVDTGSSWGTGISVSESGFIVTNAHVVANASTVRVRVDYPQGPEWFTGNVIYKFQGPLDLAMLKIRPKHTLPSLRLALDTPEKGQPVFVMGHAMLSPQPKGAAAAAAATDSRHMGWTPSVSFGNVLQVSWLEQPITGLSKGTPAMLCSSASVHAGCSGGALLVEQQVRRREDSCSGGGCPAPALAVAGVITSNSNTAGGTVLPHLNFSIPAGLLCDIWTRAADGRLTKGDLVTMDAETTCESLKCIWDLNSAI